MRQGTTLDSSLLTAQRQFLFASASHNRGNYPTLQSVWINEFHYDNRGGDKNEFIEIAYTSGVDITTHSVVVYNGNGGVVYDTINLPGTIPDQDDGFGVLILGSAGEGGDQSLADGAAQRIDGRVLQPQNRHRAMGVIGNRLGH